MNVDPLSKSEFRKVLPKNVRKNVNDKVMQNINDLLALDDSIEETYREHLLGYASVMQDGRFKIQNYLDAVRFVSYKLLGDDNGTAFTKTFPAKYQEYLDNGKTAQDIRCSVSAYNKTKLVNLIFAQTLVPMHVLNADMYQEALNVQAELMRSANSEKVRTDAANSILNQLKMPEVTKIELDIGVKEDPAIDELRATTLELVAQQKQLIQAGLMTPKQIAHSKIFKGEDEDVIEGEVIN